jgi:hypothetical protein
MKGGRMSRNLQPATAIHFIAVAPSECGDYSGLMESQVWLHSLPRPPPTPTPSFSSSATKLGLRAATVREWLDAPTRL